MKYLLPNFSHIYIEKDVRDLPLTRIALRRFWKAKIVWINHYKDIFNRLGQDFQLQKSSMKIILAKKREPFLYSASEMIQDYDNPNTFYNTPVINCLYNCDYCYLQGMYDSGNMVIFVNENDFFDAIEKKILNLEDSSKPMILSVSYNTDLLALENILPLVRRWIHFACKKNGKLIIEVRTKSGLFSSIDDIEPNDNVILSWTLSPQIICDKYESSAPPLKSRLEAIKNAIDKGWCVRICFDPILLIDDWYEIYCEFFDSIFMEIDSKKIKDFTIGVFRMNKDYFKKIKRREPRSEIFYADYQVDNNYISIDKDKREDALSRLKIKLEEKIQNKKILIWK